MRGAQTLEHAAAALQMEIADGQVAALERYLDLLEKWNRVYNLTAIRDRGRMVTHHVLDSLSVMPYVRGSSVLDVGSGAGLPGIPIAIARPALRVTLLEANQKRSAFLTQAVGELQLANVTVVTERAEAWRTEARFDTIVSRAFAELGEFVTAAGRLLAPQGVIAAMKGLHPFEEIERVPQAYRVLEVVRLAVPGLDAERHLVLVEAAAGTTEAA